MTHVEPLFHMAAFAAPAEVDTAILSAMDVAAGWDADTYGPAEVGGGKLLCIWPWLKEATFATVSARSISPGIAWVRVTAQGLDLDSLDVADRISEALKSRLGELGRDVRPPAHTTEYDRSATRLLEGEIQQLLQELAADPSSRAVLSATIFERELLLQHLTDLGV